MDVISRTECVKKPKCLDDYTVSLLELRNGLRLVLVSSDKVDKAACAVSVWAGSYNNPPDRVGLAHFLEHMLFMGSEKHPDEKEFTAFVAANGGFTNAFTSHDHTMYFASVQISALDGLLDRFVGFFQNPLMDPSAVERELEAVESEHERAVQQDGNRTWRLVAECANPEHPFYRYICGTRSSLTQLEKYNNDKPAAYKALRDTLVEFYQAEYSANLMTAVVVGKESVAELETLTVERFSKVPNRNLKQLQGHSKWNRSNCGYRQGKELNRITRSVPASPTRKELWFVWGCEDQFALWKSSPMRVLSQVFGHECRGSVLSILRKKGIALNMTCFPHGAGVGHSLFAIAFGLLQDVEITDSLVEYIGQLLYGYFRLFKQSGVPDWMMQEEVDLEKLGWMFEQMTSVEHLVMKFANTHSYPFEEILHAPYVTLEPSKDAILSVLDDLCDTRNLMLFAFDKAFEDSLQNPKVEHFVQFKYQTDPLDPQLLKKCEEVMQMEDRAFDSFVTEHGFELPKPNPYIATELEIKQKETADPELQVPQQLRVDVDGLKLYFQQVTYSSTPVLYFKIWFRVPTVNQTLEDIKSLCCTDFQTLWKDETRKLALPTTRLKDLHWCTRLCVFVTYFHAVKESLEEELYYADVAHVDISTRLLLGAGAAGRQLFSISLQGFHHKAPIALDRCLQALITCELEDRHIDAALDALRKSFQSQVTTKTPWVKVLEGLQVSLLSAGLTYEEKLAIVDGLDCKVVRQLLFTEEQFAFAKVFGPSNAECLVLGNITASETLDLFHNETRAALWRQIVQKPAEEVCEEGVGSVDLCKLSETIFKEVPEGMRLLSSGKTAVRGILVRQPNSNPDEETCGVVLSMYMDRHSRRLACFLMVLAEKTNSDFFDELRTKQTLGYAVGCHYQVVGDYYVLNFRVQSKFSSAMVLAEIVKFVKKSLFDIEKDEALIMTEEEFNVQRAATISLLQIKFKSVLSMGDAYSDEIQTKDYQFNRKEISMRFLQHEYSFGMFKEDVKKAVTDLPWIAYCVYPKSEAGEVETPPDTSVNWYQFIDPRFLSKQHFARDLSALSIPFRR